MSDSALFHNFAVRMVEITQHIEQLLLHHDCVILPGFGGFVAQECSATYVEEEDIFLPPYRSVTFNPRLTMNDGLLVNELSSSKKIDYSEALEIIESDIETIRRIIVSEGKFTFHGIGVLRESENQYYDFTPLPCGICSPDLYGLDSIYIPTLNKQEISRTKIANTDVDTVTLSIPMNFIRCAAVAAVAAVFYFICIAPLNNAISQEYSEAGMLRSLWSFIMPEHHSNSDKQSVAQPNICKEEPNISVLSAPETQVTQPEVKEESIKVQEGITNDESIDRLNQNATSQETSVKDKSQSSSIALPYTIVVASAVTVQNATAMVDSWKQQGLANVEVFTRRRMTRVIYGHYASENEAHEVLRQLRSTTDLFTEAWIYKIP